MTDLVKRADSALWHVEIEVECPYCQEVFDPESEGDFWEQFPTGYQICEPRKDVKAVCSECGKSFEFDIEGGR